jgi:hypothetical protein
VYRVCHFPLIHTRAHTHTHRVRHFDAFITQVYFGSAWCSLICERHGQFRMGHQQLTDVTNGYPLQYMCSTALLCVEACLCIRLLSFTLCSVTCSGYHSSFAAVSRKQYQKSILAHVRYESWNVYAYLLIFITLPDEIYLPNHLWSLFDAS